MLGKLKKKKTVISSAKSVDIKYLTIKSRIHGCPKELDEILMLLQKKKFRYIAELQFTKVCAEYVTLQLQYKPQQRN